MNIQIVAQKFYDHSRYIRGYSPYTIRRYRQVINFYCNYSGIKEIEQVSDDNARNLFYYGRTERSWTPNTFVCYHKSLNVFFNWCIKEKYIEHNPVVDMEIPKLTKKLPPKLTKQEALRLLEVVYNFPYEYHFLRFRNHAIFSTFIFAGIRAKELLNLKYTDIDIENLTLFINQGKGSKDRVIPICYKLAESLQKYVAERKRLGKTCPEFFASLNRNIGFTESGLKRLTEKMRMASGINFTIHKLRHTFATLMLEGGCDIYSLSKMLGHNDIKTTTIYLASSAEHLRKQIIKHPLNDIK